MKNIQFIKESLKSLKEVGTVLPSSKFVVSKMIEPINFEKDISILEFGSGTGVITKEILKKMTIRSKLICFETNESFQKELKQNFDGKITLINDSAENMKLHLNKLKITKVDYIISSIPLVTLPKKITNNILLTSSETLGKNKKFVQLQYSKMMDKRLKKYFNQIDVKFTPKNYIPAFIYTCYNQ
jgi:phospholipid N-methyltransferase